MNDQVQEEVTNNMNRVVEFIYNLTGIAPAIQSKILISIIFIIVVWLLRRLTIRVIWKRTVDTKIRYQWKKTLTYTTIVLYIVILGSVWLNGLKSLSTFFGLLSAGIAISLKDILTNIAGWIYIVLRKPFVLGDRIEIDGKMGDVIDIHIFRFVILEVGNWVDAHQSTGRIIYIPNGKIFTKPLANFHSGFKYIWNELPILVTFESNWKKAKEILKKIADTSIEMVNNTMEDQIRDASQKYMIRFEILTPTVYTSVKNSGVLLTIRYVCDPRKKRSSEQTIWEHVLTDFGKCNDIDFAYPTQRFYNNLKEGKQEARAKNDV